MQSFDKENLQLISYVSITMPVAFIYFVLMHSTQLEWRTFAENQYDLQNYHVFLYLF